MKTMRHLSIEMTQHVVRLMTTIVAASLIVWLIASTMAAQMVTPTQLATAIKGLDPWLQITAGAVIGGLLFTPANDIGKTFWEMITAQARKMMGAPEPWEKPYSQRSLEFSARERELRRASLAKVLLATSRNALDKKGLKATLPLPILFTAAVTIGLIINAIETKAGPEQICSALIFIACTFLISYTILVVPIILLGTAAMKLYFHDNRTKGRQI